VLALGSMLGSEGSILVGVERIPNRKRRIGRRRPSFKGRRRFP
jgi:hypothetical protein